MPLSNDDTILHHDAAPDEHVHKILSTLVSEGVAEALARTVVRPYSAPFYEGRTTMVGTGSPSPLLSFHAGRVRALLSCPSGTVIVGSLSQLAGGNGYTLGASPLEVKTTEEVYALATGAAASVSVWAEYAVQ